jgi:2-keto-4-pentenoate hydratase/2-oxohepta-3-ene-1,7-dioic acid hydratase in catechol pathway
MRLVTFSVRAGAGQVGLIHGNGVADLCAAFESILFEEERLSVREARDAARKAIPCSMIDLIRRGQDGVACVRRAAGLLDRMNDDRIDDPAMANGRSPSGDRIVYGQEEVVLLKPMQAFRALNIGANYDAYLAMMKIVEPFEGTAETFWKLPQAIIGPEEGIVWPISSEQITCEMELGVIIGRQGKRISKEDALDYVFGYTVVNDVTAIDLLTRGLGEGREGLPGFYYLALAKSLDTFEPIGPCITLREEIPDPQNLDGEFRVNGVVRVKGNTADMRLGVAELIEYLSRDITLYPGDLIATGAMATKEYSPQVRVQIGDQVEMEIAGIGILHNHVEG